MTPDVPEPAEPPVLDYSRRHEPDGRGSERLILLMMAAVSGLIGLAILFAVVELWIQTWPNFGLALLAAPAGLVAAAFGSIAFTAVRVAIVGEQ